MRLQKSLLAIHEWCQSWQVSLSPSKCVSILVGKEGPSKPLPLFIDHHQLEESSLQRDLGVLVSSDLSFSQHIQAQISKANKVTYLIFKMFTAGRAKAMAQAFAVYARPHLEVFSPVWNPGRRGNSLTQDCKALEAVQRTFTRSVYFRCGFPPAEYEERLRFLELPSLESRRTVLDLSLAHKLFSSPDMAGNHILPLHSRSRSLRQNHLFVPEVKAKGPRKSFFSNRIAKQWNEIPDAVKCLSNAGFKEFLKDKYYRHI